MIDQQEILEEIHSRLPAKSIGRFRCVSKAWKSLLSQPHFIKTHLNQNKQYPIKEQSLILVSDVSESLYSVKLKTAHHVFDEMTTNTLLPTKLNLDDHRFIDDRICDYLASCDGLIVVADVHNKMLLLINPTTREIKEVPVSPYDLDHRRCMTVYGLGYDFHTDDYKIVTLSYYICTNYYRRSVGYNDMDDSGCDDMIVNVYSVKNGTWKRVDNSPYDHNVVYPSDGVYVDGHIHWIANKKISDESSVVVAFDLKDEKCHTLVQLILFKRFSSGRLVILEGFLCLLCAVEDCKTEIYVMRKYNVTESWTKLTTVDDMRD